MTGAEPAFQGYVENTHDALLIFTACSQNRRPTITRRLQEKERQSIIRSGAVFVFDEPAAGIKRWTDGLSWSPSRILGNFLVYRELDKRKVAAAAAAGAQSNVLVRTASPTGSIMTPHATGSVVPHPSGSIPLSPSRMTASAGLSPPQTPVTSGSTSMSSSYARSTAGGDTVDIPTVNPDGSEGFLTIDRAQERALVGSLTSSYNFKPGGLIKKTISLGSLHMISYYTIEDVIHARLRRPSSVDEFQSMEISQELVDSASFRHPPDPTGRDADGRARYRNTEEQIISPSSGSGAPSEMSTPLNTSFSPEVQQGPPMQLGHPHPIRIPEATSRSRAPSTSSVASASYVQDPHSPTTLSPGGAGRYRRQSITSGSHPTGSSTSRMNRFDPYPTSHSVRQGHARESSATALGMAFSPSTSTTSQASHGPTTGWSPASATTQSAVALGSNGPGSVAGRFAGGASMDSTAQVASSSEHGSFHQPGVHYSPQHGTEPSRHMGQYPAYSQRSGQSTSVPMMYGLGHPQSSSGTGAQLSRPKVEEPGHQHSALYPAGVDEYNGSHYYANSSAPQAFTAPSESRSSHRHPPSSQSQTSPAETHPYSHQYSGSTSTSSASAYSYGSSPLPPFHHQSGHSHSAMSGPPHPPQASGMVMSIEASATADGPPSNLGLPHSLPPHSASGENPAQWSNSHRGGLGQSSSSFH